MLTRKLFAQGSTSTSLTLRPLSRSVRRAVTQIAGLGFSGAAMLMLPCSIGAAGLAANATTAAPAGAINSVKQSVLPGDDFYAYANGNWMDQTEIPSDRGSWGAGAELVEVTNQRLLKLLEQIPKSKDRPERHEAKVADFYAAYLDEAAIEARGLSPLQAGMERIHDISDKQKLAHVLGSTIRADVDPLNDTNYHTENLFGLWVAPGLDDSDHYRPYLLQGGLGMPDRDYYLAQQSGSAELRNKYQMHIATVLKLAGFSDPEQRAAKIFELERQIAQTHASLEDSEDVAKANNVWTKHDFDEKAPGLDWEAFFAGASLSHPRSIVVWQPSAVKGAAALVANTPLEVWKDYLDFHLIDHYADTLPKAYADEHFAFFGTALSGTPQQPVRWKRALDASNEAMRDALGKMYTDHYFPVSAKTRIQTLVADIVHAFDHRIEQLDWMAPATKAQAKDKLKNLYVGVGYPEKWQSYKRLQVYPDDALGNVARAETFRYQVSLAKLNHIVDRKEWCMPVQIVNAVNLPLQNALNFPAAILQPPFFDPQASDAFNFGSIGAVIGHEISHSFDDQGSQFDGQGRLRNWWTDVDMAHFKASSAKLVAQYSSYKPFPDLAINGQQTLSENIADLAGLAAAYDAFRAASAGKNLTSQQQQAADKEFFLGFAQSWRGKEREAAMRKQIVTDGHAPAEYRADTVRNLDAWYSAFDVKPGQGLYLDPAARVRVW